MGRLADLAAVKSADAQSFVYVPPDAAFSASRILVKVDMNTAAAPPATVDIQILDKVLRGLRRVAPQARIVIVEQADTRPTADEHDNDADDELEQSEAMDAYHLFKHHGLIERMDGEMKIAATGDLAMGNFPNALESPVHYEQLAAPTYLGEFDCSISVSSFHLLPAPTAVTATLGNLVGLLSPEHYTEYHPHDIIRRQMPDVLKDIYFTIGSLVDSAVVDASHHAEKIIWGDDLLAVDESACRLASVPMPDYLQQIRDLRDDMQR